MYNRFNLLYTWNQYILNQLHSRKKNKNKKYTKNSYNQHLDNKNRQRTWIDVFSKKIHRRPTHDKMLNITNQENQIKTKMRYHLTPENG